MKQNKYLYWITFVAVNGGLMFGLNMAGISGANDMIRSEFNLTDSGLGFVAALLTVGCLIGALFTGSFTDRYGRKKVMICTAMLYIISALGCALAQHVILLNSFRLTSGLAVGATSVVAPMYLSEVSPSHKRGALVSFNQFAITIGILLAYVFDYFLLGLSEDSWRYMLAVPAVFGLIYLLLLFTSFPESPRWLLAKGKKKEAADILEKIGGKTCLEEELPAMEASMLNEKQKEKVAVSELFRGKTGKVVLIGTLLAAFQQITGVNAVLIYAPDIFRATGALEESSMFLSMIVGLINFLMTIVALRWVDTKGRKTLLLWGAAGMAIALACLTAAFAQAVPNGLLVLLSLLVYISFFAASFAPVMWVILSEIYPNRLKGPAMSFSTAVCWLCTFLTVQFAPVINGLFGMQWFFAIFCFFSILAFGFVMFRIPETKGKSLEQLEKELGL
jgi:sugar porter (SP) family MFS transporter